MDRINVEAKYKWHLEDIIPSDEVWEAQYAALSGSIDEIKTYKGKLSQRGSLLACLNLSSKLSIELEKLFCYARMRKDEDAKVDRYVSMTDRAENLFTKFSTESSYIESEIAKIDKNTLASFIESPDFFEFDYMLKTIVRSKKHILSGKEERILAMSGACTGGYQEIFSMIDYLDLPLPEITVDGKAEKLTHGKFSLFLQHQDQAVRAAAFEGMYGAFKSLINTIAATYAGNVKKDNFYAKVRGFKSCLEKAMFNDDVPMVVYNNLLKFVGKNLKHQHKYIALRKKALGYRKLHMYDMHTSIVSNVNIAVPYEAAYDMVLEGLKPLGAEYRSLLLEARDKGWIDVVETEGKRSGAYSWGAYGVHPYVLLNYAQTTHDIFTIAHELGHAMHSYYSDKSLPYSKAGYKIFVAEVASTVNEVLLLKDLAAKTKDQEIKKYLLSYYLDMFRTTVFRQTMFAEFEKQSHEMEQKGEPLTVKSLSDYYYELNKKYYGKSVEHDDSIRYEWARIPHFYNSFYVFKYATGLISAVTIAGKILEDPGYMDVYKKNFLSAGGSKSPYEILKDIGIDLATKEPFEYAMQQFSDTLGSLEEAFGFRK